MYEALSRLRGRSIGEFRERGLQAAHSWIERLTIPLTIDEQRELRANLTADGREALTRRGSDGLLERFRDGKDGRFLAAFDDKGTTTRALRTRWAASSTIALREANDVQHGRFDLLGYRSLSFGSPIDWHLDPISGLRAPLVHWSRVPYLDASVVGDHKVVWELNRHQHFITLGRAYWASGDEAFALTIAQHIASWMDQNPPKVGINWASSLEVAFRAISWVWALHFLRESPALTSALYRRMLFFLDVHGRHLERYLSTYFSPNTHLTGEALGLYVLGRCVPVLAGAERFCRTGRRVLVDQLPRQIRSDGVYVEQSPYYQRYTVDFYLFALALAERSNDMFGNEVVPRLSAAADHLMYLMRPDGTWPLIGDDDGGQLLPFRHGDPSDYRSTLALAAVAFGRGDLAAVAGEASEELLWIHGADGPRRFDEIAPGHPMHTSRAFPEGGFFVMRDDWTSTSDYAVIDAGDHGFLNAGHAHADALGIDLALEGIPLFVDPGTGSYTADSVARDYYRSSAVHNTVNLDERSSSEPGPTAFRWATMARATSREWLSSSQFDFFRGSHDGYGRLPSPAQHERSVLFLKQRYWIVRDRIVSSGPHRIGLHFHCSPSIVVDQIGPKELRFRAPGRAMRARVVVVDDEGAFRLTEERMSPMYGKQVRTSGCTYECRSEGTREIVSIFGCEPLEVRRVAPGAIEILTADARDLLLTVEEGEGVSTDASLTWVRRCRTTGRPLELLLLDVSRCTVDGTEVVSSAQREPFVEARMGQSGWDRLGSTSVEAR